MTTTTPAMTAMTSATMRPVEWLWPGRIALREVTILSGDSETDNGLIAVDLVARVTSGRSLLSIEDTVAGKENDRQTAPLKVLLGFCDDTMETTVMPRLLASGGDGSQVIDISSFINDTFTHPLESNISLLGRQIRDENAKLVVISPISGFSASDRGSSTDRITRELKWLAYTTECSIIVIGRPGDATVARIGLRTEWCCSDFSSLSVSWNKVGSCKKKDTLFYSVRPTFVGDISTVKVEWEKQVCDD